MGCCFGGHREVLGERLRRDWSRKRLQRFAAGFRDHPSGAEPGLGVRGMAIGRRTGAAFSVSWWRLFRSRLHRLVDKFTVVVWDRRTRGPTQIGQGQHDCALSSLYWAVPSIPEPLIVEAFNLAAENWPYGGVTNKEFAIALKYLKVDSGYSTDITTLEELLIDQPGRCVALLRRHFVAIVDGVIVGPDADRYWSPGTHVYCRWTFTQRAFRPVRRSHHTACGSA